ncbi:MULTISPECIES: hypothetical protein [unclassified Bradyrhizobium]
MIPGGLTEAISYFSGYLHLFDDIARDRVQLDGGPGARAADGDDTPRPLQNSAPLSFDDLQTTAVEPPGNLPDDTHQFVRVPQSHLPKIIWPEADVPDAPDRLLPPAPPPFFSGGGGGGGGGAGASFDVKVVYHPGGEQSEIETHQVNALFNDGNDLIGTTYPPIMNHLIQISDQLLGTMIHQVSDAIPESWKLPHDTSAIVSALGAADKDWNNSHGGSGNPPSVKEGYQLNGQPDATEPDALHQNLTSPLDHKPGDTGHQLGQWADVGDNHLTNAAQIVDLGSACKTMIVLGNDYTTNAIFQVNASANRDHVETSGSGETSGGVHFTPDESTNAAGFVQHASVYAGSPGAPGATWDIDVVNGNYHQVHTLTQVNYLSNNDVVEQKSSDTHYEVVAGENQLMNVAQLTNGDFKYDMIIVGGSYHSANMIYQYNILVNNDIIHSANSAGGADGLGEPSISLGGNHLINAATIDTYGGQSVKPLNGGLQQIVNQIENGQTSMDPSLASQIHGYGGTLHVLYVTGDYYDVNAIWQTNLLQDSNYVLQEETSPAPGNPLIGNGAAEQSVIAGHDMDLNLASIVSVKPDQAFVDGQVYSDSVLIQANMLPQGGCSGGSGGHWNDPHALAPEIVAFLNDTKIVDPTPHPVVHVTTMVHHDDPMSHMMH